MTVDEPPDGFTIFSATSRGRELGKPLLFQSILVGLFWLGLFAALWLWLDQGLWSLLVLPFGFITMAFGAAALARIHNAPVAVNAAHPWSDAEDDGDAEVLLRSQSGWQDVGEVPLRVVPRQLSSEWVITLEDQGRTEFGLWLYANTSERDLNLHLSLLKEAVALRNMYNGSGDDFEAARAREDDDSGLLERQWLDTTPGQNELEFGALLRAGRRDTIDSESGED